MPYNIIVTVRCRHIFSFMVICFYRAIVIDLHIYFYSIGLFMLIKKRNPTPPYIFTIIIIDFIMIYNVTYDISTTL